MRKESEKGNRDGGAALVKENHGQRTAIRGPGTQLRIISYII